MSEGSRVYEAGGAPLARVTEGDGPVLVFALHAGHDARPALHHAFGLSEDERFREEDPFTAAMMPDGLTAVEVLRTRFEVDLNRPRFRAVYQGPKDAWGLRVWDGELPDTEDRVSREVYDAFYALAFDVISAALQRHERAVIFDLHSYNHRRDGALAPAADPQSNPEVNLGTGRFDRSAWAPVVEAFSESLDDAGYDCRENVKFKGGHFAEWVTETFGGRACALAIEFKKVYMDEWTGVPDHDAIARNRRALATAADAVEAALGRLG